MCSLKLFTGTLYRQTSLYHPPLPPLPSPPPPLPPSPPPLQIVTLLSSREQQESASASSVVEEVLSSIKTVVAFGGEKIEADRCVKNSCLKV